MTDERVIDDGSEQLSHPETSPGDGSFLASVGNLLEHFIVPRAREATSNVSWGC